MIVLSSMAFAAIPLECDEQDVACNGAEDIAGLINQAYGSQLIRESASNKRHRTSTIRKQLQVIINNADRAGCEIDSFVGLDIPAPHGQFDGLWNNGEANVVDGNLSFTSTNKGTLGGSTGFGGVFGNGEGGFGVFEQFKMVADWDNEGPGFMAGKYMRAYGSHFVGWGAVGTCSDPAEAFDNWYPGDLSEFYNDEEPPPGGDFYWPEAGMTGNCPAFGLFPNSFSSLSGGPPPALVMTDGLGGSWYAPDTQGPLLFTDSGFGFMNVTDTEETVEGSLYLFEEPSFYAYDDATSQSCSAYGLYGDI